MKIHYIEQRTEDWFILKNGKVSGSSIKKVFSSTYLKYVSDIVAQRLIGYVESESFVSDAMMRGIDLEPFIKAELEELKSVEVTEVGFVELNKYVGISPDGIIFKDGLPFIGCEYKALDTKNHIDIIRTNKVPAEYIKQCLLQLFCMPTMEKVYFVSYDDRLKQYPLHIIEVKREDYTKQLEEMETKLNKFIEEVEKLEKKITNPF